MFAIIFYRCADDERAGNESDEPLLLSREDETLHGSGCTWTERK